MTTHCQSPCIKKCGIDETRMCSGCYRTGLEIAAWRSLSNDEKWAIVNQLDARKNQKHNTVPTE